MSPIETELFPDVSYIAEQYAAPPARNSRAGQLAVELAAEKKRLLDDLRELQAENEDLKSTTPVGTVDWYVKWAATCLSVSGIFDVCGPGPAGPNRLCHQRRRPGYSWGYNGAIEPS